MSSETDFVPFDIAMVRRFSAGDSFFPDFFPTCVDNHGNNGQIGQIPRKIVQTPPLPRGVDYHSLKTPCCNTEFLTPCAHGEAIPWDELVVGTGI